MEILLNTVTRKVVLPDSPYSRINVKRRGVYPATLQTYDNDGQANLDPETPVAFRALDDQGNVLMASVCTLSDQTYSFFIDTTTQEIEDAFAENPKAIVLKGEIVWGSSLQSESFTVRVEHGLALGGETVTPVPVQVIVDWNNVTGRPLAFPPEVLNSYSALVAINTTNYPVLATVRTVVIEGQVPEVWQLTTYTGDAESAFLKKPTNFNALTNNKSWIRIS
jgi:hypothetical protein